MEKSKNIHFIMTGGTIDSIWDGAKDTVVTSEHSVLPEYFSNLGRNLKPYEELLFTEICMKDSGQLTLEEREKVLLTIEESPTVKIIVTHGTYTMPDTAHYLQNNLIRKDQTIVLTGSFTPIKGFDFSDGPFQLGYAFAQIQKLPLGCIYV